MISWATCVWLGTLIWGLKIGLELTFELVTGVWGCPRWKESWEYIGGQRSHFYVFCIIRVSAPLLSNNLDGEVKHSLEDEQSILLESSRPNRLFSEPTLTQKRFTHGCTLKFTFIVSSYLSTPCKASHSGCVRLDSLGQPRLDSSPNPVQSLENCSAFPQTCSARGTGTRRCRSRLICIHFLNM